MPAAFQAMIFMMRQPRYYYAHTLPLDAYTSAIYGSHDITKAALYAIISRCQQLIRNSEISVAAAP